MSDEVFTPEGAEGWHPTDERGAPKEEWQQRWEDAGRLIEDEGLRGRYEIAVGQMVEERHYAEELSEDRKQFESLFEDKVNERKETDPDVKKIYDDASRPIAKMYTSTNALGAAYRHRKALFEANLEDNLEARVKASVDLSHDLFEGEIVQPEVLLSRDFGQEEFVGRLESVSRNWADLVERIVASEKSSWFSTRRTLEPSTVLREEFGLEGS